MPNPQTTKKPQFNPMGARPYPAMRFVGYSIATFLFGWLSHDLFGELLTDIMRMFK